MLESATELRFTLFILHYPNRLVLELEDVAPGLLDTLAAQLPAAHSHLQSLRIRPAPDGKRAVQLEFGLRKETYPGIRTLKPADGRGYQLVLDITPRTASPATPPATAAPAQLPPVPPPAPAPAPAAASPPLAGVVLLPGPAESLLLEVALDQHVLAEAITAYQDGRRVFLPLGELAGVLTLPIRTQPSQGTAEGFTLDEQRSFRLSVPQSRAVLGEQAQTFDPALVRVHADDIYVESALLSRWLPVDFHVDLARLTLRVRPRETLPLQSRLERERAGARLGRRSGGYEDPGFPRLESPYRLLGVPFIDQTLGLGLKVGNGPTQTSASYTGFLTGDFLGMESSLFVRSTNDDPSAELRYILGRSDPDARLLGPLRARSFLFGSGVAMPSVQHVAVRTPVGDGLGFTASNRPLNQPTDFDRHTLEGDLPPGWDVELYYNDALVGFQRSTANGRYRFEDLPLSYGPNEFRLVFHGPLGQRRVERQTFLLDQNSTPAGTLHYRLTGHRDDSGALRSIGQFEWGLNRHLAVGAGWVRLPGSAAEGSAGSSLYSRLGVRGSWRNLLASSDLFRSPDGGWLSDSTVKTRIGLVSVDYGHLHLHAFTSEAFPAGGDRLRMRDKLRLQTVLPAGWLPSLPLTLEVQRDQLASGSTHLLVGGRVSAVIGRTSLSHQLTWQDLAGTTSAVGALSLSHRVGSFGVAAQVGYTVSPHVRLETVAVNGERQLGNGYLLNLGVARGVSSGQTSYSTSLNKSHGAYGLGLSASYSDRAGLGLGLQLFIAMGREPRQGNWHASAHSMANTGAASIRVFLDANGNGLFDAGEEPIANAGLTLNGSGLPARTDGLGIAWLDRLPIHTPLNIAVDVQTLEDPYWQPQRAGVRLVARPGYVATIEFPVALTTEIDGTVYLAEGGARRGIGNVTLELLGATGKLVSSTRSSSDGYYVVTGVLPGEYTLRPSPQQAKQLGFQEPEPKKITIGNEGQFVNGADFVLRR